MVRFVLSSSFGVVFCHSYPKSAVIVYIIKLRAGRTSSQAVARDKLLREKGDAEISSYNKGREASAKHIDRGT